MRTETQTETQLKRLSQFKFMFTDSKTQSVGMAETDASPDSKASSAQLRKIKKPIIERRRRERINESLNQVKTLVLDALNKDESRFSKMEKADILEMTVKHLKTIQKQEQQGSHVQSLSAAAVAMNRYRAGYTECAREVRRYLASVDGVSPGVHERLTSHLESMTRRAAAAASATVAAGSVSGNTRIECASTGASVVTNASVVSIGGASGAQQPIRKLPLAAAFRSSSAGGANVTVVNASAAPVSLNCMSNGNAPVIPLVANGSNTHTALPLQTLTISGTTTRVLFASQPVAMPTTVTLIAREQSMESRINSELSSGTAIPLYINTEQFGEGLGAPAHSPGASDGESGGSMSPGSTTSNASSNSHHWAAPPPPERRPGSVKPLQSPSPFFGPVWRPW